jgi:hypothetical protein
MAGQSIKSLTVRNQHYLCSVARRTGAGRKAGEIWGTNCSQREPSVLSDNNGTRKRFINTHRERRARMARATPSIRAGQSW